MTFSILADGNRYTYLNLEGALQNSNARGIVRLPGNQLASVNITGCVQLTELYLENNLLGADVEDAILATLDSLGRHRSDANDTQLLIVDFRGDSNAVPSDTGRISAQNLAAKGWTIYTNDWTEAPSP